MPDQPFHLYLSTACFHEQASQDPGLHAACRQTCKYCDAPCSCPGHPRGADSVETIPWVDQARTVARQLYETALLTGALPPELACRLDSDPLLFWLRGEVKPPGEWHPPGETRSTDPQLADLARRQLAASRYRGPSRSGGRYRPMCTRLPGAAELPAGGLGVGSPARTRVLSIRQVPVQRGGGAQRASLADLNASSGGIRSHQRKDQAEALMSTIQNRIPVAAVAGLVTFPCQKVIGSSKSLHVCCGERPAGGTVSDRE